MNRSKQRVYHPEFCCMQCKFMGCLLSPLIMQVTLLPLFFGKYHQTMKKFCSTRQVMCCVFQNCMIAWRSSLKTETLHSIMKFDALKDWWLFANEYSTYNITAQSLARETGCLGFRLS